MVWRVQPGCSGAAARLPKKPGIQKLTPPSSANDACETSARVRAKAPVDMLRVSRAWLVRDVGCDAVRLVVRFMSAPRPFKSDLPTRQGTAAPATDSSG